MSPKFATELADVRLLQTKYLLESLLEDAEDPRGINRAITAVEDAHATVRDLRAAQ